MELMTRIRPDPAFLRATMAPLLAVALSLGACASASITQDGGLSSYEGMTPVKTSRIRARIVADAPALAAARSVRIAPVSYAPGAGGAVSAEQRAVVANLIARTLCVKLSDRFDIVAGDGPADLTVRAVITRLTPTNREAAGASVPLRVATMAVGVPMPFRIPVGLGALAAEGEAVDAAGARRAAMVWARGADALTNRARVSRIGDAYDLAGGFAGDMAALIVTGRNPLHDLPADPFAKRQRPVAAACEVYGKSSGAGKFLSGFIGGPPEWTDSKARPPPN
jgi:hypothetical protein